MEVEEIQAQECKFRRFGVAANGRPEPDKITNTDDKQDRDLKRVSCNSNIMGVGANDDLLLAGRLRGWPQSSRIIRVSRASGGKDRHSKVWTSKGLRDRRVRLSVTTAIQFYDLQDRLGYDQPSKAVEWLINAASDSIAELPALDTSFPQTLRQPNDEKRMTEKARLDSADADGGDDAAAAFRQQQHNLSLSKSVYSSTSETSKGSRFDIRVKRRESANERTDKKKDKEKEKETHDHNHQNVNPILQNSSFIELLAGAAGGGISIVSNHAAIASPSAQLEPNFFPKQQPPQTARQWPTAQIDYFGSHSSVFPGHIQLGNSLPQALLFSNEGENHSELEHFPFVTDHHLMGTSTSHQQPNAANRGTLQSNLLSPSLVMPHLQRFPPLDGSSSNFPFFSGTAAASAPAAPPTENHYHHQHQQLPTGLQLSYSDGSSRQSDNKGKGKN